MDPSALASLVDEMLDSGFSGTTTDYRDALVDENHEIEADRVETALREMENRNAARRSPRGNWYRVGRLVKQPESCRGVGGREIGAFVRRIVYIPELTPDSLLLLTLREGSRAFRLRAYDEAASRLRFVTVPDANNDYTELERLYGPFTHDIWWDDADVKGVDDVEYWVKTLGVWNRKLGIR